MTDAKGFATGLGASFDQWHDATRSLPAWALEYLSRRRAPRRHVRHLALERQGLLVGHALQLAAWLAARQSLGQTRFVGISGGQGSGKSTLTALLAVYLQQVYNRRVAVVSLDDFYLPRRDRERLARTVHPLFETRGVPGTHDVELGRALMDALAGPGLVTLPRFDKGLDDRLDPQRWPTVQAPVDMVLLEGWCVGAPPQSEAALVRPVNALEAEQDAGGRWRKAVNAELAGPYSQLFGRLDENIFLQVPDFDAVRRWRADQEARLQETTGRGMDAGQLEHFIAHYERITRHMLEVMPARASLLLTLDQDHAIASVREGAVQG